MLRGYLDWRGNLDLNLLIRTLLVAQVAKKSLNPLAPLDITPYDLFSYIEEVNPQPSRVNLHYPTLNSVWGKIGAGIVPDSNPKKECSQSLHKAQALFKALQRV
mgnify:CR=1 FL=1